MAEFRFEIAKKFQTNQAKGMELRSISLIPDGYRAVLREENRKYDRLKDAVAKVRLEKSARISFRGTGKSLEVVSDSLTVLSDVIRGTGIVNDDMASFLDFLSLKLTDVLNVPGFETGIGDISLGPKAVTMSFLSKAEEGSEPEKLFETLLPIINEYDMGLIK